MQKHTCHKLAILLPYNHITKPLTKFLQTINNSSIQIKKFYVLPHLQLSYTLLHQPPKELIQCYNSSNSFSRTLPSSPCISKAEFLPEATFNFKVKTKPAHYVPVLSFRFNCESLFESEFLQHYTIPDKLNTTADKLRWYRIKNGYLQSENADIISVYRSTYIHYENPSRKLYELDKLQLLADLYQVDIECLLDDYMVFLYRGQGKQLKAMRKELGLTQRQFADMVDVRYVSLKQWERERFVMLHENYTKINKYL